MPSTRTIPARLAAANAALRAFCSTGEISDSVTNRHGGRASAFSWATLRSPGPAASTVPRFISTALCANVRSGISPSGSSTLAWRGYLPDARRTTRDGADGAATVL